MLCGEFYNSSVCLHLKFNNPSDYYSPYSSLLALIQMASVTRNKMNDEEDIYLENGLLSYENPNYHMDPAYIYDEINSNTQSSYDISQQDEDMMDHFTKNFVTDMPHRKTYASLDISMMGVDLTNDKMTKNNSNLKLNERKKGLLTEYVNNELSEEYDKIFTSKKNENEDAIKNSNITSELEEKSASFPSGWEKHEDSEGPYYWHIKSGVIQRELPKFPENSMRSKKLSEDDIAFAFSGKTSHEPMVTRSNTSSALDSETDDYRWKEKYAFKRRSYPSKSDFDRKELPIRFAVRSLGWVEIGEDDLTPEKSSKAVNKCIVDLSVGKNDLLDVVGRWGDGKDLFMDLDEGALKLVDPENLTILNTQPIHTIRVWGVGRENGRDFAYVARDRMTRKHMCHVFRCDMPARTIANTLRDICKKIMIERSLQQNHEKSLDLSHKCKPTRPTNLPTERRFMKNHHGVVNQSFPTPMEEPKKVINAHYLGSTQVVQAVGMDILNDAINELSVKPKNQWHFVNISVAPSMITIHHADDNTLLAECRVRYLSFLGIGKIVKYCAFIMHTAQDTFIAHVFHCEPSSGALCKTIEAACKLRYQKCLDAHPNGYERSQNNSPGKSIGAALKSIVDSITGRRVKSLDS